MCNFSIELLEEADAPFGAETQDVADAKFPRRPGEGFPGRAVDALVQHRLDHGLGLAATEPAALEPGGNDLRVVDDEAVPRPQEFGQVAHAAILKFGLPAGPYHEKPGRVARLHRAQGDAIGRKVEVEEVGTHDAFVLYFVVYLERTMVTWSCRRAGRSNRQPSRRARCAQRGAATEQPWRPCQSSLTLRSMP